jgi:hypothetical protein
MSSRASETGAVADPDAAARSRPKEWSTSLILGLGLLLVYTANSQDLGTDDTVATTLLPLSIIRGDGVSLNRSQSLLRERDGSLALFVTRSHGQIISRYPVAPALLIMPLVAPQVALLDRRFPGWDRHPPLALRECKWMAKRSMAVVMVLGMVILYRLMLRLDLRRRAALPAVLAAALGSELWVVGSQALWQHGPAAVALIAAVALLCPGPVPGWRIGLAGLATTVLVSTRLIDTLFAVVILAWVARTQPRHLGWFLPAPALGAVALLGYNLWYFGTISGGQAQLEELHLRLHGVRSMWAESTLEGAVGTLFSPNRGLFIFSPWIAVALGLAMVPAVARRLAAHGLVCWLLAALVPYFLLLSKYAVWWGGHCFGPRYWTDVIPLFAIVLAFGLEGMPANARALVAVLALTIVFSIGVQAIGAFCFPSTWNLLPLNVDLHHQRLWDWRDTELSRCLIEKFQGGAH